MQKKETAENNQISLENKEPDQEPYDNERRKVIKKAVYTAPVLLTLVLTDKAYALSGPPPPPFDPNNPFPPEF